MSTDLRHSVPVLHVADMTAATAFYCDKLGFETASTHQPHEDSVNPAYGVIRRGECALHLSSFSGDGKPGGVAVIFVDDVNALHAEFGDGGVDVGLAPTDQSWGNREMYIADPDGNQLRFTQLPRKGGSDG